LRKVKLLTATSEEFWRWWGQTSPPNNDSKDPTLSTIPLPTPRVKRVR